MFSTQNVYLFVPNIIGYIRLILLFVFYMCDKRVNIWIQVSFYAISQILDGVDGNVARYLNQCSELGANLDMILDRASTVILLFKIVKDTIVYEYLKHFMLFFLLLDLFSHWLQMIISKSKGMSHKELISKFDVLNYYYTYRYQFMLPLCILNEAFYLYIYVSGQFMFKSWIMQAIGLVSFGGYMTKNVVHFF